jgi:uncharacterized protein DUF3617
MRTKILLVVLFSAVTVAWAAQKIEPLNVKLGLWEMTMTTRTIGEMPIPAESLSKLSPEQRAKLEERMKARSAGTAQTHTYKTCLTKEKVTSNPFADKKNCTSTILTSTSSKIALKVQCTEQEVQMGGNLEFEALNTENVKGSGRMAATGGDHTMNVDATYTGKWIGSACGDVK